MSEDKLVDESWKDAVASEKAGGCGSGCGCDKKQECGEGQTDCAEGCDSGCGGDEAEIPVNFFTFTTSMGYQAMIFLGEIPNPMTGQPQKNLRQAKFIIDTLLMMKDKTRNNLTEQESSFLEGTLYELQMKFVGLAKDEGQILT